MYKGPEVIGYITVLGAAGVAVRPSVTDDDSDIRPRQQGL